LENVNANDNDCLPNHWGLQTINVVYESHLGVAQLVTCLGCQKSETNVMSNPSMVVNNTTPNFCTMKGGLNKKLAQTVVVEYTQNKVLETHFNINVKGPPNLMEDSITPARTKNTKSCAFQDQIHLGLEQISTHGRSGGKNLI